MTLNLRADGSSKFGENNRYGIFPSVAARWTLSNESFLQSDNINNLALRVGYGQVGNQEFPSGSATERYELNNGGGTRIVNVANADLRWETSTTANVGVDFALFDYKVTGTVEYYSRVTDDLLLDAVVSQPGNGARAWRNINGEVANSGFEVLLSTYLIDNATTKLSFGVNAAFLQNELRNFGDGELMIGQLFGQGASGATIQLMTDGQPLNTFSLRQFEGLDADGLSIFAAEEALFLSGDPNANTVLGFNVNLDVNDFFAGMNWNGAFGHQIYNNTAQTVLPISNLGSRNIDASLLDSDVMESTANALTPSTRYLEDGDFVKLNNLVVGYRFGDMGSFKNFTVSVVGENLLVFTNYTGFDPEVNTVNLVNGIPSNGIEYSPYPTARRFLVNLSVSF